MFVYGTEATRRGWATGLIVKVVADVITDAVFDTSISRDVGPYLIDVVQSCRLRVDFHCDNEEKSWNDYEWLNDPHGCYAGFLRPISSKSQQRVARVLFG
jgi:hypothetical protein